MTATEKLFSDLRIGDLFLTKDSVWIKKADTYAESLGPHKYGMCNFMLDGTMANHGSEIVHALDPSDVGIILFNHFKMQKK